MVTLHGKNLSWSSSTGDSDSSSEDDRIRFYNQPSGSRQKSSSSSSESDSEDFSDGSFSEPKRTAEDPSSSMKVKKKNGKRIREDFTGREEALGEEKSARNSSYTGGKRSPPRQSETLLKGSTEKIRAKSRKEKKSSTNTDPEQVERQYLSYFGSNYGLGEEHGNLDNGDVTEKIAGGEGESGLDDVDDLEEGEIQERQTERERAELERKTIRIKAEGHAHEAS